MYVKIKSDRYPNIIGTLQYLENYVRPHISTSVAIMSQYQSKSRFVIS